MHWDESADVVVVGGGLAGLAAATLLARRGRRVRLLEQAREVGGRARTGEAAGYHFNLGPHALYRGGPGMALLKELGVTFAGAKPPVSGAFAVRGGVKHTFPAGPLSLLTTGLFGPAAKLETGRFLGSLGKLDADCRADLSLREWLERHVLRPEVRDLVLAVIRVATYVNAPERLSAEAALKQLQSALGAGVLYLDGGWQTLVDGLRRQAERAGAQIETGAKAQAIERDPAGRVRGVRAAGRFYAAPAVIVAASPQTAAALADGASATLAAYAEQATPVRAACLDVALDHLPVPQATFALGIDRPLYLSAHSAAARLAPAGGALLHTAIYLPPDHDRPPAEDERELEGLLDLIQPGWRAAVVRRQFLPRLTVMHALPAAQLGGLAGRPGPAVPAVPGLYVAGDWVGGEGMLADAALASARRAAEMVEQRLEVRGQMFVAGQIA